MDVAIRTCCDCQQNVLKYLMYGSQSNDDIDTSTNDASMVQEEKLDSLMLCSHTNVKRAKTW